MITARFLDAPLALSLPKGVEETRLPVAARPGPDPLLTSAGDILRSSTTRRSL
jgi:hypothetical protein